MIRQVVHTLLGSLFKAGFDHFFPQRLLFFAALHLSRMISAGWAGYTTVLRVGTVQTPVEHTTGLHRVIGKKIPTQSPIDLKNHPEEPHGVFGYVW